MEIRSLTQAEAEARAALIDVQRYDIHVDLTALPTGPEVRCTSVMTFTCAEPGAGTFVDCVAEVVAANLNGVALAPAEGGRIALTDLQADNVLTRRDRAGRDHARARACTGPSTPPTARSTSGCRSSRTRPGASGRASTSPTSRPRTRSR